MGRITHVEITATDIERATGFYAKAFGWRTESSPYVAKYRLADTGPGEGVDGAIMTREYQDQPAVPWIEVDDIDAALEAVGGAGGSVVNEKSTIPGVAQVVYIRDTEGTVLGLKQPL